MRRHGGPRIVLSDFSRELSATELRKGKKLTFSAIVSHVIHSDFSDECASLADI